jgi:thiol:disulfide interchange protein DsbD
MALTFTLVSFTCTFAFAGGLLVLAAKGEYFWPILGMLAFSAAFSLPFFFLALFPSLLQKLPQSGGWMNRVKVTMGIIEVAAALKFLNIADQMWNPVPLIFDYPVVMSAWVVLALATGLYLLGAFRLPHDSPTEGLSVPRLTFVVAFFGLGGYLAVGLFAPEKMGDLFAAFAPPQFVGGKGDVGPYLEHDGLKYALSFDHARQFAQRKNQPMFLEFTGVNCVNCRLMERRMKQPRNRRELKKFVLVQLYTDSVPHIQDRQLAGKLKESNLRLQEDWFGDVTLPAYAVVTPDGKTVLATFKGLERRNGEFARFLADGHAKWMQLASRDRKTAESSPVTSIR